MRLNRIEKFFKLFQIRLNVSNFLWDRNERQEKETGLNTIEALACTIKEPKVENESFGGAE